MMNHCLGVERSFLGQAWHERLDGVSHSHALAMVQRHGLPDLLARVLAGRGVTAESCQSFLQPTLRTLMPDPATLVDMDRATERLAQAVERDEQVAIFGDYDVDGAASAALLANFLRSAGLEPLVHIPDRLTEGYGPNETAIGKLATRGARLLVTVDCGTASLGPLAAARRHGLDVIVLDHHRAPAELPPASALVNPNRLDDLSGLGHLCAAGVVFMTLVGLNRRLRQTGFWKGRTEPDLLADLDLVALATVADVVPLVGLNRAFVTKGLAVMRERARPGLRALFDVAGADGPPTAFQLGFLIGPRINAGGRIGDSSLGARLLMTEDPLEARQVAEQLDRLNRERRVVELAAVEEAEAEALAKLVGASGDDACLVCASPDWHPGVLGLVAARLKERYGRPVFALSIAGDTAVGSGRSVVGLDLGGAVVAAVAGGLVHKGGGHALAAGVTVAADKLEAFRAFLNDHFAASIGEARAGAALPVDATLSARALTPELIAALENAGPFGAGHPEAIVAFPRVSLKTVQVVGTDHIRVGAETPEGVKLQAVAFRAAGSPLAAELQRGIGRSVHLAGTLALNRWGGGAGRAELRLVDAALA